MKLKASTGRKLRYGGTSVAITALVIAAIIIVNVVFSLLTERFRWYADLTPDLHFTISEECFQLIEESDEDVREKYYMADDAVIYVIDAAAEVETTAAKKLAKERKRKRKALEGQAEQQRRDLETLEKYRLKYEQQKARKARSN